jgi:hypothetical protein
MFVTGMHVHYRVAYLDPEEGPSGEVPREFGLVLTTVEALVESRGGAREAAGGGVEVDGAVSDALEHELFLQRKTEELRRGCILNLY